MFVLIDLNDNGPARTGQTAFLGQDKKISRDLRNPVTGRANVQCQTHIR
jgi:hypothetical protein